MHSHLSDLLALSRAFGSLRVSLGLLLNCWWSPVNGPINTASQLIMADDKKRDDFELEMGERNGNTFDQKPTVPRPAAPPIASVVNNPVFPILSYCGSSILMTVMNKYVLSGLDFNLNFFLLCVQVCIGILGL